MVGICWDAAIIINTIHHQCCHCHQHLSRHHPHWILRRSGCHLSKLTFYNAGKEILQKKDKFENTRQRKIKG